MTSLTASTADPGPIESKQTRANPWLLLIGLLIVGLLAGYLIGNRTNRAPANIVLGKPLVAASGARRETRQQVPVVFGASKWHPRLIVLSPLWDSTSFASVTDTANAHVEFRYGTNAPLPEVVYFQLWNDDGSLRDVASIDLNELSSLKSIYCSELGGIEFEPHNLGQQVTVYPKDGIGILGSRSDEVSPDDRHNINVVVDWAKSAHHALLAIGSDTDGGVVKVDPKQWGQPGQLKIDFESSSRAAEQWYVFVVLDMWTHCPRLAFRAKGEDLLKLNSIEIRDRHGEGGARFPTVLFNPAIPADFWPLDGGSQ